MLESELKDISVLGSSKINKMGNILGRLTKPKAWYTASRQRRRKEQGVLFIADQYLDYKKSNFGNYSLRQGLWNEGFNFRSKVIDKSDTPKT